MSLETLAKKLREEALKYPETYEESPWGDRVVKVKGKIFFSCNVHKGELYSSCKLPKSSKKALERPYAEPTHYGMGKYGWVTFKFGKEKDVPVEELRAWMDESYRAIAPKSVVKLLENGNKKQQGTGDRGPATGDVRKAKGKVVLVCADKLRSGRAKKAYEARGLTCEVVEDAGKVKIGKAKALVVDIGRNPPEGIALARKVDEGDAEVHLFVAGVRDAVQARELRELGSAETFRAPPGDDEVADAVVKALGGARRAP
jgi:predicted DNA-binding protein (MmcQ/YjbR family)